jgi:hypothetical protein|tara:strand:- start:7102 stop:7476 length:375 start_codon:yes stop_codon:yes gene_type:complete
MSLLKIITILIAIETGGHPDPVNAVGDGGKALGILQMHKAYVADAAEYANVDWTHVDALDPLEAKDIFLAYMSRYAKMERKPNDMSYEEFVSRIHSGGPLGYKKKSTISYWEKFKKLYGQQQRI